jgi:hypothetical protein
MLQRKIILFLIRELSSAKKQVVDHFSYPSEQLFGGYRVVQKTRKGVLTNHLQKITNETKNQPSSLYTPPVRVGQKAQFYFLTISYQKITRHPKN